MVVAAVVLRVVALSDFETTPAADHPMVDAHTYWQQAKALFAGKNPFAEGYYQPPAYPWVLAKVGAIWGEMDLAWVRRLHLVLGVSTTVAVLGLGRRLGAALARPWLGPLAGALFVLSPTPLLFEHDVLTPALTLALSAWGALALVHAAQRSSRGLALLGGLLVGGACAVHPTYLLAAVAGGGWLAARRGAGRTLALVAAVGVAAPLAPTTLDNARQFGVFELVSHNGGLNFYLGNNPRMRETAFLRAGLPFRKLVLEADPASRSLPERNAWWWARARAEAAAAPMATLAVLGVKSVWSVNAVEIPRNEDYRCRTSSDQPLAWVARLPAGFGLLFPLALVGAVALGRRRDSSLGLLGVWAALHAPLILFLVSDRYRVATWPCVVLLAALGLLVLAGRRPRWSLAVAGVGLVVAWAPIDARTALDPAWCRYQAANLAFMERDLEGAEAGYRAVVAQPGWEDDIGAHYWLGTLADEREDWAAAIEHYDVVLASFSDHFPTLVARADASYYAGRKSECADHLLRAYRVPGNRTSTGVKLVKLLRRLGRTAEADALLAENPRLAAHPKLQ